jgi:hypothetical protein
MSDSLTDLLALYDDQAPLPYAHTIPASWYVDERVSLLEREKVFASNWIALGRADQVAGAGQFCTFDLAGEPLVVIRGADQSCVLFTMCAATTLPLLRPLRAEWRSFCAAPITAGPTVWTVR